MNFEALVNQIKNNELPSKLTIPSSWSQGRTVFGGLSAALLYVAMRKEVESERVLRSMNTSFVAPLQVELPLIIEVEVLRKGGSVSQLLARAIQNEQTCVLVQASFGKDRESRITVDSKDRHRLIEPEKGLIAPQIEGVTPSFLKHFEISACKGQMPFSNSSNHDLGGWIRFSDMTTEPKDEHLIAMIDAWPPTVLQMFNDLAPASSLSWNLEFIHPHAPLKNTSWFAYEAHTRQAASGYAHTEANIWNEHGDLIAISRQAVVAFQ